jgi:hypothetical protein
VKQSFCIYFYFFIMYFFHLRSRMEDATRHNHWQTGTIKKKEDAISPQKDVGR